MDLKKALEDKKEYWLIAYKIFSDIIFLLSVFLLLLVFSESILSGALTQHVSYFSIVFSIGILSGINLFIAEFFKLKTKKHPLEKKFFPFLFFWVALIFLNSLWRVNIFLNIFTLVLSVASIWLVSKVIFEEEE